MVRVAENRVERRPHLVGHDGEEAVFRLRRIGELHELGLQLVPQDLELFVPELDRGTLLLELPPDPELLDRVLDRSR